MWVAWDLRGTERAQLNELGVFHAAPDAKLSTLILKSNGPDRHGMHTGRSF